MPMALPRRSLTPTTVLKNRRLYCGVARRSIRNAVQDTIHPPPPQTCAILTLMRRGRDAETFFEDHLTVCDDDHIKRELLEGALLDLEGDQTRPSVVRCYQIIDVILTQFTARHGWIRLGVRRVLTARVHRLFFNLTIQAGQKVVCGDGDRSVRLGVYGSETDQSGLEHTMRPDSVPELCLNGSTLHASVVKYFIQLLQHFGPTNSDKRYARISTVERTLLTALTRPRSRTEPFMPPNKLM